MIQLHRPQLETPSASARTLAEATARFSARRARDLLPVSIHTHRLVLRAPIRGDVPELVKLGDNPNVARWVSVLPQPYLAVHAIRFIEVVAQRPEERPYAITLDGTFIGIVGFYFPSNGPPLLWYWLGEPHWGHGYATEAVRGLVDAAQQTREFPVIRTHVLADNAASLKVLEKTGFKRIGEEVPTEGPWAGQPSLLFELEQPRWTLV